MAHFNMIQKEDLGWVGSSETLTINDNSLTKDITLLPVSSSQSGIKMIKVRRADGRYYSVEYRQALGYDGIKERSFNNLNFDGFLVYLDEESIGNRPLMMDSQFEDFRASSDLTTGTGVSFYVNFDITDSMHERGLFSLNEIFNDTVSDIVVTAQSLGSGSATITVNRGSVIDDGSDDVDPDDVDPDDGSGDVTFDASFISARTLSSVITLDLKKKTKVLLVIPDDETKVDDFTVYKAVRSSAFKKISKLKKNRFDLYGGVTVPIFLAPEKTFIKKGLQSDSNGEYTVSVTIKEKGRFPSSSPQAMSFKVKSADFN